METHVKVLAILHIAFGVLGALAALAVLAIFGGIAGLVGALAEPEAEAAVPILGIVGGALFVILLVLSIPGLVAGIGLLNYCNWARILTLILSALNLLNIPLGTALGIYGFWVLLSPNTEVLFRAHR